MDSDKEQSGYYREIARVFLGRRGGALLLSPRDAAAVAAWEAKRIPLDAVLEGIGRTFDGLQARGRATRTITLAFCDREVEAAFAQLRERAAGGSRPGAPPPPKDKSGRIRGEIEQALGRLAAGDAGLQRLLRRALEVLAAPEPDEAALERLDAEIEAALWAVATAAEKAAAEAEARTAHKGRRPAGFEDTARRRAVMAARDRLRVPHVSLHFH